MLNSCYRESDVTSTMVVNYHTGDVHFTGKLVGTSLHITILGYENEPIIVPNSEFNQAEDLKPLVHEKINKFSRTQNLKKKERTIELQKLAKESKPEVIIFEEQETTTLDLNSSSIQDKFSEIICASNKTIASINENNILGSKEELANAFINAKEQVSKYTEYTPGTVMTFASKYVGDTK